MVYSSSLRSAGNKFMINSLNYNPGTGYGGEPPDNNGGDFIGAHLRRKDFLQSRKKSVPSLEGAVSQLRVLLEALNLSKVFVASDASSETDCKCIILYNYPVHKSGSLKFYLGQMF